MTLKEKAIAISDLIRLPKQYGTLLLLCPTLWSLVLASKGDPSIELLFIFIGGCFLMRSAGCAINDIADRKFDVNVERTKDRPVTSGRLSVLEALAVFVLLSLTALYLVLKLNDLTIKLSFIAIILAVLYPFIKRYSHFPQVFLGTAFGFGAIMASTAVSGTVTIPAVLFFLANIFWSTAYDTIYALMDSEDDYKIGVKSTALFFGKHVYMAILISYTLTIALLVLAGFHGGLGIIYQSGLVLTYLIFILILRSIIKNSERSNLLKGFINNTYAGILILISIILDLTLNI